MTAVVTKPGLALDMQVCVPKEWTDDQAIAFAESEWLCGTTAGWSIRREGHQLLGGTAERVQCSDDLNQVHIMLDA